jgi:ribonuclease HI
MIKFRLDWFTDKNNIIARAQAGFRRGRACTEQLVRITSHVKKALVRGKKVSAAFYDIKKAFDSVWHKKLLLKLQKVGIKGRMFNMLHDFLSNRQIRVRVKGQLSKNHTINMGVPQGSVLGPILFNLALHDIDQIPIKKAHLSAYADDIALWSQPYGANGKPGKNKSNPNNNFRHNVKILTDYLSDNGFELSPLKTVFMIFGGNWQSRDGQYISVNGHNIKPVQQVKFLGVWLTPLLSWGTHINHVITKTHKYINLIKAITLQKWASSTKHKLMLVRSFIRSTLAYGQEVFYSAPHSDLHKLTALEVGIISMALGLPQKPNAERVYSEIDWTPLDIERTQRVAEFVIRTKTTDTSIIDETTKKFAFPNEITKEAFHRKRPTTAARCESIYEHTHKLFEAADVSPDSVMHKQVPQYPPWEIETPEIRINHLGDFTKKDHPNIIGSLAKEYISQNFSTFLQVYTDGSKLSENQIGSAFTIPALKVEKRYQLNRHLSIFTAELYAIYRALSYMLDYPRTVTQLAILVDSKAVLMAIERGGKSRTDLVSEIQWLSHLLITKGTQLIFCWTPSHSGVKGNEQADHAAVAAAHGNNAESVTIPLDKKECASQLKAASKKQQQQRIETLLKNRNWFAFEPNIVYSLPQLPNPLTEIMNRLRYRRIKAKYTPQVCVCLELISIEHLFDPCQALRNELKDLLSLCLMWNIPYDPQTIINKHPTLGWLPLISLTKSIFRSSISSYI